MGFWFVAMWVVKIVTIFMIVRSLLQKPNSPQPKGLSDFTFPTTDPSRAIPVVFGTCKLTGPAVLWYGDFSLQGFSLPGSKGKDVGYYYFIGMDLGLCHGPVDEVVGLYFEDQWAGFTHIADTGGAKIYEMDNTMLFGGNVSGGGIVGRAYVYLGDSNPTISAYMQAKCSADYPGLAHMCHIVFRGIPSWSTSTTWATGHTGMYVGTSEYVKTMAATVIRCPNTLGMTGDKHRTTIAGGHDANPACILYEILTDSTWGLGLDPAGIDTQSFLDAGDVLYGEAFGLSMIFEQQQEAKDFLAEVLRHIDADLYADPETGKLTLALVRGGYDPEDLPLLDESMVESVEFTRRSWSETANVAQITFTNRQDNFNPRMAIAYDSANLARRGEKAVLQVEFRGISCDGPAALAAARVLRASSYPFAQLKVVVNRCAYKLRPAGLFRLKWAPLGIESMVLRIARPSDGKLEDGKISLDCAEDAFSVSSTVYTGAGSGQWTDPIAPPEAADAEALLELPFHLAGGPLRKVVALASRGEATFLRGFEIWSDPSGGTSYVKTGDSSVFLAAGTLDEEMPAETDAIVGGSGWPIGGYAADLAMLASVTETEFLAGANLMLIDNEIMAWRDWNPSTGMVSRIMRGLFDTVPAYHGGGRVWFLRLPLPEVYPSAPYPADLTVAAKILPNTLRDQLHLADAARLTLATASRALKTLPPGRVRLNNIAWPTSLTGDVVVTWAHRNRALQLAAEALVSQDDTSSGWIIEGTYTIQVWVGGVHKRNVTGVTDATWTWTTAMQATDTATVGSAVAIRIIPVTGSLSGNYQERSFVLA
jgi:hypothetical protein